MTKLIVFFSPLFRMRLKSDYSVDRIRLLELFKMNFPLPIEFSWLMS